jgi:hypothetical protein
MRFSQVKRTDIGTILIHLWLVCTLAVSILTGLRFAVDLSESAWLRTIAPLLPVSIVWIVHLFAGVSVFAITVAYPLYLLTTGLTRRVTLDRARIASIVTPGPARWSAVNILLYWVLFACLAIQLATGMALFRGYGGWVVELHLRATWLIAIYAVLHVLTHFVSGGSAQLLRIFRPTAIPTPYSGGQDGAPWRKRSAAAGLSVLAFSIGAGLLAGVSFVRYDRSMRDVLQVMRVPAAAMQNLQANLSDSVWRVPPLIVQTNQGVNFDGAGATSVEIRAVRDDQFIVMALSWSDPTRSLKHAPLLKTPDGWHAMFTPPEKERSMARMEKASFAKETLAYFSDSVVEDKFAIMLTTIEKPYGPGAFHPGARPLAGVPPSSSGRGLHYTEDGSTPNVWLWHANGANSMRCENARVGGAAKPSSDQIRGLAAYKGGIAAEPSEATVVDNFWPTLPQDPALNVTPARLPKTLETPRTDNLNPDYGDEADQRWFLTDRQSEPYTADRDARIPVGTIIPGLLAPDPRAPSPRDVLCSAKWAGGRWTLLVKRRLDTGAKDDVAISSGTFMWVAAFDHTVADHTRHIRPIRLELK